MNCDTCAFFLSDEGEDGDCTRYPPTTVVITTSFFPRLRKDQSCGEWMAKIIQ